MSITFIDGFDLYSGTVGLSTRYTLVNTPNLTTGRFGTGQACSMNNALIQLGQVATSTLSIGHALKCVGVTSFGGSASDIIRLDNTGSGTVCRLGIDSTGKIRFGRGDYTTNLICQSAAGVIVENAWNYLELEFTRNGTTGSVNIYLNGSLVAGASGVNTGSLDIDRIAWPNINDSTTRIIDDMYVTNTATKLGECKCVVLPPNADTATKQWTPSTGVNNFANVDDATFNGDTDYNASSTVGQQDLYDVTDLSYTPLAIKAVQTVLCARKDDATTRAIRTNLKSGATTSNGATVGMGTTYGLSYNIYETDPNTAAAWTAAAVNAAQLGIEVVT